MEWLKCLSMYVGILACSMVVDSDLQFLGSTSYILLLAFGELHEKGWRIRVVRCEGGGTV